MFVEAIYVADGQWQILFDTVRTIIVAGWLQRSMKWRDRSTDILERIYKVLTFFMVDVWNTNQYNKNTPATENKIENNSFWVVIVVNMEADNDVIIKYFIFICFIVTSLGETGLFLLSEFKTKNAQYYSLMIVYQ